MSSFQRIYFNINYQVRSTIKNYHSFTPRNHQVRTFSTRTSNLCSKENEDWSEKRKKIEEEIKILLSDPSTAKFAPSTGIPETEWPYLLSLPTKNQRRRFYRYLKKIENTAVADAESKKQRQIENQQRQKELELNPHIKYGLWRNTMFLRTNQKTKNKFYDVRLGQAVLFGQKLVFDMGFEDKMDRREYKTCLEELGRCYNINKLDKDPFDLHFCNVNFGTNFCKDFFKILPQLNKDNTIVTVTDKSYLDLFPKERIVYLTPNTDIDLVYNHNDVYIIGSIVDASPTALTRDKALKEGLRMARLPIAKHVKNKGIYPNLIIKHVLRILLKMKSTGNWEEAFQVLPDWRI